MTQAYLTEYQRNAITDVLCAITKNMSPLEIVNQGTHSSINHACKLLISVCLEMNKDIFHGEA